MNALKKYKDRQYREKAREIVNENMDNFIEHMDLIILYALHKEFGFEAVRSQFVKPGDDNRFWQKGGRMDTYALKYYLKEIGFDYDAVCEKKLKENSERKEENGQ